MPRKFISTWIEESERALVQMKIMPQKQFDLTIVFLKPSEAKKINFKFRKKNYPTDVLSFEGEFEGSLGELVLCPKVIEKQSKEHMLSIRQELGYLLLHGILHLLGFDHEKNKQDAIKMFAIQDEIFEKLCRTFWK